jgi:hypothetical protein
LADGGLTFLAGLDPTGPTSAPLLVFIDLAEPAPFAPADALPVIDPVSGQIFYLDFDGATGVTYEGPITIEGISVPVFTTPTGLAGQEGVSPPSGRVAERGVRRTRCFVHRRGAAQPGLLHDIRRGR